jgi:hypothetical protein
VDFTVLFNGLQVTTGSFNWDSSGSDYIAGSMRDSTVTAGEFNVSTVPEPSVGAIILGSFSAMVMGLFFRRRNA